MHIAPRLGLLTVVLAVSYHFVAHRLQGMDGQAMLRELAGLSWGRIGLSVLAVAVAFVAVAGQERAIVAHMALPLARWRGARTAAAAAAVAQLVGFGPVVGALVRHKLLPDLSLRQSFAISAGITLGFFAGLSVLTLVCFAVVPGMPYRAASQAGLAAVAGLVALMALSPGGQVLGLRKPNLFILLRFLFWLAVDLTALAAALWIVLPAQAGPGFLALLPVFLVALGVGMASGSPGGVGPFEATLLTYLPQVEEAGLLAAIIAFRALAFVLPAALGAVWLLVGRRPDNRPAALPLAEYHFVTQDVLQALPGAEVQLIRQGGLAMLSRQGAWLWLTGKLSHTRVMLGGAMASGDVPCDADQALDTVHDLARSEARMLCLYKIEPRLAARARARGWAVLPIAREAVLDPQVWTKDGPSHARLRRKLAHARKAGVVVAEGGPLPLAEMAEVVADWRQAHGRERGFSMGRFERAYVAGQRVVTARAADGALTAFVSFHAGQHDWVLDLVRFRPGTPDGTTYAMLCHALDLARAEGLTRLSLAAVPDAAFGLSGLMARLAQRATLGSIGLAQFKSAFSPRWEPRYMAAPSRTALVLGGLEVAHAILRPGRLPPRPAGLVVHEGGAALAQSDAVGRRAA